MSNGQELLEQYLRELREIHLSGPLINELQVTENSKVFSIQLVKY